MFYLNCKISHSRPEASCSCSETRHHMVARIPMARTLVPFHGNLMALIEEQTYLASVPVCPLSLNIIVVICNPYLKSSFEFFLPGQLPTFKCCAFWSLMSTMHSSMFMCSLRAFCLQHSMKMKSFNFQKFLHLAERTRTMESNLAFLLNWAASPDSFVHTCTVSGSN